MNRACVVKTKDGELKGVFHRWSHQAYVVPASPMIGGSPPGQVSTTVAIVELESGEITLAPPLRVKFTDN